MSTPNDHAEPIPAPTPQDYEEGAVDHYQFVHSPNDFPRSWAQLWIRRAVAAEQSLRVAQDNIQSHTARIAELESLLDDVDRTFTRLASENKDLWGKLSAARALIPEGVKTFGTPAVAERSRACCQHCGWECPSQEHRTARDAINAHAAVCEKHPQRAVEARVRELEAENATLKATVQRWTDELDETLYTSLLGSEQK